MAEDERLAEIERFRGLVDDQQARIGKLVATAEFKLELIDTIRAARDEGAMSADEAAIRIAECDRDRAECLHLAALHQLWLVELERMFGMLAVL